jgi:CheY-like chemotaxis protein
LLKATFLHCYPESVAGVLILSRDWQSRALLRAQLIEEGLDVRAFPSSLEAGTALAASPFQPELILADFSTTSVRDEAEPVARLARDLFVDAVPLPVWVIARRSDEAWLPPRGEPFEAILFRPIDVGELIERIKKRVRDGGGTGGASPRLP